ncbi:hypothetical protein QFC19_000013 [Naganishia cerealis]|uniref:Uncharacterized protein n=1 Tax=Naganishia cerealis TaxID=610337 RepID=A0ACC2WRL8_9TREE|nr:hypothetical protein QFC19_000013 [Naganishia cerealis]
MASSYASDGSGVRRNVPAEPSTAAQRHRPLSDADARLKQNANVYGPSSLSSGTRRPGKATSSWGYGSQEHWKDREMSIVKGEKRWIVGLTVLAVIIRCWKIWQPSSVVFDEVHFGGFARKYIKQTFFMDVHPPLAKLLITLAALVGRFDGDFDFKDIGKDYLEPHVPYITMRMLPALLGVAVVPIAYLTLRAFGARRTTAILAGLLITFENGLVTQSRLILLDSPLIFFTALTAYLWVKFSNEDAYGIPFARKWWTYLFLSGLSLGAVVSCKWVGLFTIATIGVCVLRQLWLLLGNLRVTPRMWLRHFAARALCLIVVPILFYMFMFQIHFWVLNRSGEGDGFMSSEFQHTLIGHGMEDTYADVALGSTISIRHVNTQGGYLHSHTHSYPTGSNQQQITLYPHRDENNNWRVLNGSSESGPADYDWDKLPLQYVENGMKIRLEHIITEKRLHSHDVRPPISEVDFQNEVSGYGFPGFAGDANDDFVVEITQETRGGKDKRKARQRIRTLRSHFRLRHAMTGCYLFSHKVKLPEWGFEQQEVGTSLCHIEDKALADYTPMAMVGDMQQESYMGQLALVRRNEHASSTDGFPDSRDAYHPHKSAEPSIPAGAETTLAPLVPEPGQNVFDDLKEEPEQKTIAVAGPPREEEIPVSVSPDAADTEEAVAVSENAQDTRAPLGKDAGAAEATFADAVGGGAGWQGGAEDAPGVLIPRDEGGNAQATAEGNQGKAAGGSNSALELDDEQVDLVEHALREAENDLEALE